ncbi:MAG: YciI family protein [Gammaproteobacteria bacterium]|nr:YciI family protein [Gammaproteobacteria bacterium]
MLYAISGTDVRDSLAGRKQARTEHLARVTALRDAGRLILAGPHPAIDSTEPGKLGYTGSLIVAEFPSLDEATAWANADPYVAAGVWAEVSVRPFIQVMP